MEKVEETKTKAQEQLEDIKRDGNETSEPPIGLKSYVTFLASLKSLIKGNDLEVKVKIIKRLVHRIEVSAKEVKVFYNVDEGSLCGSPCVWAPAFFCAQNLARLIFQTKRLIRSPQFPRTPTHFITL